MNYATIKKHDIANGPGVRVSLFVSGCSHHCPGCFNPETWDFNYGKPFDSDAINEVLQAMEPSYIHGFSLLGGEPFELKNQQGVLPLLKDIKAYEDSGQMIEATVGNTQLIWFFQNDVAEQELLWLQKKQTLEDVLTYADEHRSESMTE